MRGRAGAIVVAALVVAGCATERMADHRATYLAAHPEADAATREAIERGEVRVGMTPEEVRAALGPPMHRASLTAEGVRLDRWTYPARRVFRRAIARIRVQDALARLTFREGLLTQIDLQE